MNERLIQFLAAENISQAQFADSINVARAGISHIVAGRNKPSTDFIISTMNRYPTLNIEWLLTGKGKMYKSATAAVNEVKNAVNEGNGAKMEADTLFGDEDSHSSGAEGKNESEMFEPETVESDQPYAAQQPVGQSMNQPSTVYISPQNSPQNAAKRPKVAKIIVFFDDGTFQECK